MKKIPSRAGFPRRLPYHIQTSRVAGSHLPQLAGEGGAERRMGCGPLLEPKPDCTTGAANLLRAVPAFRTPSGLRPPSPLRGEGETAGRAQLHETHREFDLCEFGSHKQRDAGEKRETPCRIRDGSARLARPAHPIPFCARPVSRSQDPVDEDYTQFAGGERRLPWRRRGGEDHRMIAQGASRRP